MAARRSTTVQKAATGSPPKSTTGPDDALLREFYRQMVLIRRFEERAARSYTQAQIGGYCHLNLGEEATVVGLMSAMESSDLLRRTDITAVIEARIAIEAEAAALAAERRTPVELRAMRRALAERQRSRSGIEDHVDTDTAFHRSIVVAAHNPILTELFDGLTPRSRQAMIEMLRIRGTFGDNVDQVAHELLLEAVAGGDISKAAELSRAHLLGMKQAMSWPAAGCQLVATCTCCPPVSSLSCGKVSGTTVCGVPAAAQIVS